MKRVAGDGWFQMFAAIAGLAAVVSLVGSIQARRSPGPALAPAAAPRRRRRPRRPSTSRSAPRSRPLPPPRRPRLPGRCRSLSPPPPLRRRPPRRRRRPRLRSR
ncbi:MAG: hypothetical protein M0D55_16740 [Elusimicrobiota bacterium]|nr:MAG: hypothetical protein M0D55_16740 [Elusimicrobiota bacterium]